MPAWSSQLEETLIRRSIFGTAALEGNPLKEEEVGKIIGETGQPEKSARAEQEIRNLKAAYQFIRELTPASTPPVIDEALIKKVHALITAHIDHPYNVPGLYRNHKVQVGDKDHGGVYTPPKCLPDIEKLMQEFILWINSEQMLATNPYLRAALALSPGLIHPFSDGTAGARIIEALLLRLSGQKYVPTMLSNYYYRNMDEYFCAFSITRKDKESDVSPFIKFVLKGVIDSLEEIKNRITYFIRRLALRDYFAALHREKAIIQRQHDLLTLLLQLQDAKPFKLQDLFNTPSMNALYRNVSERTARRDLKKLMGMNLLTCVNDQYTLNLEALG